MGLLFNNACVTGIRNQTRWHIETRASTSVRRGRCGREKEREGKKWYATDKIIDITGSPSLPIQAPDLNAKPTDASRWCAHPDGVLREDSLFLIKQNNNTLINWLIKHHAPIMLLHQWHRHLIHPSSRWLPDACILFISSQFYQFVSIEKCRGMKRISIKYDTTVMYRVYRVYQNLFWKETSLFTDYIIHKKLWFFFNNNIYLNTAYKHKEQMYYIMVYNRMEYLNDSFLLTLSSILVANTNLNCYCNPQEKLRSKINGSSWT